MGLTLEKGGNISLEKASPGLKNITIGLGWDLRVTDGEDFDLDVSAFLTNDQGKVRSNADFIFYNQPSSAEGSVVYNGDNRTGEGSGDDETLTVDLSAVPADVAKVVIAVTIDKGEERKQNFGSVKNAYVRILDKDKGDTEIDGTRYDLGEDFSTEVAVVFAELYRYSGSWKWRAVGQGYSTGLKGLANDHGVAV